MLGGRGLLFGRLEVDVDYVALLKLGQKLVLLVVVIILSPARLKNHHASEYKGFQLSHRNGDLALGNHAILGAKDRNKTAEHRGIDLHLPLIQILFAWDLIGGRERRVGFDLAIVKDGLAILEFHRIADLGAAGKDLTDLVLLRRGKILRVGTGIGQVSFLVKSLHDLQTILHGHLIFLTQYVLQVGQGKELSGMQNVLFVLDPRYDRSCIVVQLAHLQNVLIFILVKLAFGIQFHDLSVCFFLTCHGIVLFGNEIADRQIPVIDRLDNGNDDTSHTQKRSCFQGGVASQIHAVKPVDIGPGKALIRQAVVFGLLLHLPQRLGNRLRGLVGEP